MPTWCQYEWDMEFLDAEQFAALIGDPDIVDHRFADSLDEFADDEIRDAILEDERRLALTRQDEQGQSWAYVKDGVLSTELRDAYDVFVAPTPKKFIQEFNRIKKDLKNKKLLP